MTRRQTGLLILVAVGVYAAYIIMPFVTPFSIEATLTTVDGEQTADVVYTADPRGVLRFGDCVTLSWQVGDAAQDVTLDGEPVAHTGQQRACIGLEDTPELVITLPDRTRNALDQNVIVLQRFWSVWVGIAVVAGFALYALHLLGVWRVPAGVQQAWPAVTDRLLMIWYLAAMVLLVILTGVTLLVTWQVLGAATFDFAPDWPAMLLGFARGVLALAFYMAAAVSAGALVFRAFGPLPRLHPLTLAASLLFVGMGVLATLLLYVAIAGGLGLPLVVAVLLLALAAGGRYGWPVLRAVPGAVSGAVRAAWNEETTAWRGIMVTLGLAVLLSLLVMVRPYDIDSGTFYLVNSRLTALAGALRVNELSYLIYSGFHVEMQFAALILLSGETAARGLSWISALGLAAIGLALADHIGARRRGKITLLAMLYSSSVFINLGVFGKTDMIATATALAAIFWALQISGEHPRLASAVTGLLAAFAVMGKLTYAPLLAVYLLVLLVWRHRNDHLWQRLAWVAAFGILPVLLHLLRNALLLGEPLAPVFFFNGSPLPESGVPGFERWGIYGEDTMWAARTAYPLMSVLVVQDEGRMTALVAILLPLLLLRPVWTPTVRQLVVPALLALLAWNVATFAVVEIRYVLAFWILMFVVLASAANDLSRFAVGTIPLALAVTMAHTLFWLGIAAVYHGQMAAGTCQRDAGCFAAPVLNEVAAADARVLFIGTHLVYLRDDLLLQVASREDIMSLTGPDFWEQAGRAGYDYVVYDRQRIAFFDLTIPAPPDSLASLAVVEAATGTVDLGLWELRSIPEDVK